MNKKILALTLILLAIPIMGAIPVQAKKGQNRLSIKFQVGMYDQTTGTIGREWTSPHDSAEPNVYHMRDADWGDPTTHVGFSIVVDEGGDFEETFDDEEITYSCSFDLNLFFSKPVLCATIKVRETWDLGERGYIEILAVEYLYDLYGPDYSGSGIFVGHGEIDGQKIKLSGEAGTGATGPFRQGIVMGWPTT